MTRWILALSAFAALNGCIIYDSTGGKCHECDDENEGGGGPDDNNGGGDDTATDDTAGGDDTSGGDDTAVEASPWSLDPSSGAPGDLLIVSFARQDGSDVSTVSSITPYGEVTVGQLSNNGVAILAPLQVSGNAMQGTVDFLVTLSDGNAEWIEDGFSIIPAGGQDTGSGTEGEEPDTGTGGTDTGGCN